MLFESCGRNKSQHYQRKGRNSGDGIWLIKLYFGYFGPAFWGVVLPGQTNQQIAADSGFVQSFGVDSIEIQNLTVQLNIPVFSKPRFFYEWVGFSNCTKALDLSSHIGAYCGLNTIKANNRNNGDAYGNDTAGFWTLNWSSAGPGTCAADGKSIWNYVGLTLTGPTGNVFYFKNSDVIQTESGGTACIINLNDYTQQGGIHVVTNNSVQNPTITFPNGSKPSVISGNPAFTDTFGNQTLHTLFSGIWTDIYSNTSFSAPGNPPITAGYYDTTGNQRSVTQVMTAATFKTNFACSGVTDETISGTALTQVNYPDGNNLSFTYEPVTGGVTGRIWQLTYRTGGTATYTYGTINCASLIPSSLTRTTTDGATTYTFALNGTHGTMTTVLDPGKNKTVYYFQGTDANGLPVQGTPLTLTEVQVYQNTGTVASPINTLISTTIYCYNNNTTACPTTQAAYPIVAKDAYVAPGSKTTYSRVHQDFDTYGNVTTVSRYKDFVAIGAGTATETTTITYGSWNGTNCVAIGSGIVNKPCDITVRDAASNALSEEKFTYGTKGFMTSHYLWGGAQWITTTASANANGTPAYTINAMGTRTDYGYAATGGGGCNLMLPTSTGTTVGTTTFGILATWDCNMGKLLTSTDANGNQSTFTYDLLGRPLSQTDPTTYAVSEYYGIAPTVVQVSDAYVTTLGTVDGLGRPIRSQKTDCSNYDTITTAYGFNGTQFQTSFSQPCIVAINIDCTKNHFLTNDPLGRSITSSTTSNETLTNTYNQNDVSVTLSPFPSGEHNKVGQTEYDGMGRPLSTCALQASGGTACGQIAGGSGILTSYAYSSGAWSRTVTATRGSQAHTTVVDALGRPTSVTTPEAGTTTYVYDTATVTCGSGTAPGVLVEQIDNAGVHTCYGIDGLGRTTQAHDPTYSNGCRSWVYGDQYSGTPTVSNATLRVAEAYTDSNCSGTSKVTDEYFSYDKVGRTTDVYETTPHSGGQYHTQAGFALNGVLTSLSGVPGKSTYTIGLDPNGRPDTSTYGVTAVATNVNYNAAGQPTEIDYGTDKDLYPRDPNTGLMTGWTFTLGATSQTATLTWNPNRTLKTLAITDGFNALGTQTCNYNPTDHAGTGYDDVGRLVGVYCANGGTVRWTQTYGYDQYDNFSKTGTTSWSPGYSATNNHITGAGYDSDGQVTYDLNNSYGWDGYHKMTATNSGAVLGSCGSAGVTCYTYDAMGRGVEKNVAGTFTEFLYSPAGLTGIMSGMTTNAFRAPIPGGNVFTNNGSGSIVSHLDWLGSARLSETLGHSLSRDTSFSPYGENYSNSGTGVVQNFAGMFSDLSPNLLFDTPNRQFDTSAGSRWLSPDPARASWNAYSYPTNPNSFTDPSGLQLMCCDGGGDGGGGGGVGDPGYCPPEFSDCNPGNCDPVFGCGGGPGGRRAWRRRSGR